MAKFLLLLVLLTTPSMAHAYVGPGMGAGAIAAVLGVIGSLLLGLFAVIYYPLKRAIKKRKERNIQSQSE